jgi:hypothetical protein
LYPLTPDDVLLAQLSETLCVVVTVVPLPDRVTLTGEFVASLTKLILPVAVPDAVGANFAEYVTLAPGAIVFGKVKLNTVKPVPAVLAAVNVIDVVAELFVNVPVRVRLCPTVTLPKLKLVGVAARLTLVVGALVPTAS